jgi:NADPH2:quinone reductase
LLVEVRAISVNPVDAKIRAGSGPGKPRGELPILGWDAAGVVRQVGTEVTLFKPGDEIYYAGSLDRPGSYAEFQCVDERLASTKPKSVGFAAAAALPLTAITAWEMLFDRLRVDKSSNESLLILGGAVASVPLPFNWQSSSQISILSPPHQDRKHKTGAVESGLIM